MKQHPSFLYLLLELHQDAKFILIYFLHYFCDLSLFFSADPPGEHDHGQSEDTEASRQWSSPPHHDLWPQRQQLSLRHDLSPCKCTATAEALQMFAPSLNWRVPVSRLHKNHIQNTFARFHRSSSPLCSQHDQICGKAQSFSLFHGCFAPFNSSFWNHSAYGSMWLHLQRRSTRYLAEIKSLSFLSQKYFHTLMR